MQVSIVVM